MNYSDKTILITGASSGIGAATALELAKFNNRIIITARRENLLKKIAGKITAAGSDVLAISGDATQESHSREVVQKIINTYGDIDIAILNVGIGPPSNTLTAPPEKIKFCLETNYYSFIHFFVDQLVKMR